MSPTATRTGSDRAEFQEKGMSLARGPVLLMGTILSVLGLIFLLHNADMPSFSSNFPDGNVDGTDLLGFELNGWTAWLLIAAGVLLLFAAAQHHLAKLMAALVGIGAIIAGILTIAGGDILGLAAGNWLTGIGWLVVGGLLLLMALAPRRTRTRRVTLADRDGDGIPDREERADHGHGRDRDGDGVPDDRERTTPRDRDGDGVPDDRERRPLT